jgi:hypothetical protein
VSVRDELRGMSAGSCQPAADEFEVESRHALIPRLLVERSGKGIMEAFEGLGPLDATQ